MRADRLLRIVFRLQGRRLVTASTLARELEVSTRTIRRDMEALSAAGIPVYSTRGGAGGWSLVQEYQTSLTGLNASEALATIIGHPSGILTDLGLDDPGEELVLKLLAAVAPAAREQAEHARQRIHIDPDLYWEPVASNPSPKLRQLVAASWDDRMVELRYGSGNTVSQVAPYGLVRKGTRWYLIAQVHDQVRTYRISRIHELTVTEATFSRPTTFDLATHWRKSQQEYTRRFGSYPVRLRIRGEALARAGWAHARSKSLGTPDPDGWVEAEFDTEDWDGAIGLLGGLGADVVVLAPHRLRREALANATRFLKLNR
ncbi:WYL domain-containing protein [Microlunatus elymi]|uniref:WYL domain-containing protein n=1 Tax=Microlunatus elymi TaxID=2596828 RepID=A0A516PVW6_9ACTN|nr:WYL domain-containing protein [Microlunatus elymi]QDP95328.1 WYL domain-containing protein [Microlunatus elymi]